MQNFKQVPMSKETLKSKKWRIKKILYLLKKYHPLADCALHYKNPLQLLVATVLSAQCTDKRVNQVTKTLFKKYPSAKAFASADLKELEQEIYSTGFFRSKSEKIKKACQKIQKEFKGKVPDQLGDLLSLSGVGKKNSSCDFGGQPFR